MDKKDQQMQEQIQQAEDIKQQAGGLEKWLGYMVKKGFPVIAPNAYEAEWMWVEVKKIENDCLVGNLSNRPVFATYLEFGEEVAVKEEEIFGAIWPED